MRLVQRSRQHESLLLILRLLFFPQLQSPLIFSCSMCRWCYYCCSFSFFLINFPIAVSPSLHPTHHQLLLSPYYPRSPPPNFATTIGAAVTNCSYPLIPLLLLLVLLLTILLLCSLLKQLLLLVSHYPYILSEPALPSSSSSPPSHRTP